MGINNFPYKTIFLALPLLLASCSNGASPQFFNGHYYMTGDNNCRRFRQLSPDDTTITCYNKKMETTGYRTALTDQELMMYMQNQQIQSQQFNSIMNNVNNGNRMMQEQNQTQMFYNYLNMPRY